MHGVLGTHASLNRPCSASSQVLQAAIEGQLSSRSPGDGVPEITVSEVELHQDLRFARIFVTIQGARTMKEKRQILRGLDSCTECVWQLN